MPTTPLSGLPYPLGTILPFVHTDLANLANAVDAKLFIVCTSSTRPAHSAGRRIHETDTKRAYESNGSIWEPLHNTIKTGGVPNPLFGTYGGQPLQVVGAFANGSTDSNSICTFSFSSVAPWTRGLMSFVPVSTNDPSYQIRVIRPAPSATSVQMVLRTHDTGAGVGALGSVGIQWIAVGW